MTDEQRLALLCDTADMTATLLRSQVELARAISVAPGIKAGGLIASLRAARAAIDGVLGLIDA